jgi:hypothetical protein
MKTIACKALVAFTEFVPSYGQVHGDPESSLKEAQKPEVPVSAIAKLVDEGRIEAPKGFKAADAEEAPAEEQAPA